MAGPTRVLLGRGFGRAEVLQEAGVVAPVQPGARAGDAQ
jgi:hypothetical protein